MMVIKRPKISKQRLGLFFLLVGIFLVSFVVGTELINPTEEQAQTFLDMFKEQVKGIDGIGIFAHNTLMSLPMFIPFFGLLWGSLVAFQTGGAVAHLLVLEPNALQGLPVLSIFASPFGLMELTAYGIAMSRSLILTLSYLAGMKDSTIRSRFRRKWLSTVIDISILVVLLFVGGLVEYEIIKFALEVGLIEEGLF